MDRLIYTALSGLKASMNRQHVIASNMANTNTLGFRAETVDQRPVTLTGGPNEVRAMQTAAVRGADMAEGEITETGNPLDVAVTGATLIAVQATDGEEAYTRRGDLSVSSAGLLVNGEGLAVLGDGGPITVPPGGLPRIGADGGVTVSDPAAPDKAPETIGRIKLASYDGSQLAKGLDGLFRVEGGGVLPGDMEARLTTGSLEASNVKPSEVLVDMIESQRMFAMRTKMISTARDLDERGAQLMRLT